MSNGMMINELRSLIASDSEISARDVSRLIAAGLVEVSEKLDYVHDEQLSYRVKREVIDSSNQEKLNEMYRVTINNPLIVMGTAIRDHPKIAATVFIVLLIIIGVAWPLLRIPLYTALGIPLEVVTVMP